LGVAPGIFGIFGMPLGVDGELLSPGMLGMLGIFAILLIFGMIIRYC